MIGLLAATGGDDPVPWPVAAVLGPVLLLGGVLLAWVGFISRRGRLPRNRLVGLRTPRTLASDAAWDAAHRAGGPWLIAASIGSIGPGLAVLFRPPNRVAPTIILVGMAIVVALTMIGGIIGHFAAEGADET